MGSRRSGSPVALTPWWSQNAWGMRMWPLPSKPMDMFYPTKKAGSLGRWKIKSWGMRHEIHQHFINTNGYTRQNSVNPSDCHKLTHRVTMRVSATAQYGGRPGKHLSGRLRIRRSEVQILTGAPPQILTPQVIADFLLATPRPKMAHGPQNLHRKTRLTGCGRV